MVIYACIRSPVFGSVLDTTRSIASFFWVLLGWYTSYYSDNCDTSFTGWEYYGWSVNVFCENEVDVLIEEGVRRSSRTATGYYLYTSESRSLLQYPSSSSVVCVCLSVGSCPTEIMAIEQMVLDNCVKSHIECLKVITFPIYFLEVPKVQSKSVPGCALCDVSAKTFHVLDQFEYVLRGQFCSMCQAQGCVGSAMN
jgi:hypothetical protein